MTNLQGDATAILDSTGAIMVNYHYGMLLQTGGTMATTLGALNPLTYRGYVYDHETGLYYLQSRYYNPIFRQFISADAYISTGQGFLGYNMFAYCGNNPVTREDSEGSFWLISIGVGLLTQYVADVIENVADGKTGVDIFIPTSTPGEYIAAGVTAIIPGKGLGTAIIRNIASEGITLLESKFNGEEPNVFDSAFNVVIGTIMDLAFEKVTDKVVDYIGSKAPKNYSSYAHTARRSNPGLTREQIYKKMRRILKLNAFISDAASKAFDLANTLLQD